MKKEVLRRSWNFYRKWLISIFLRYGNLEIHVHQHTCTFVATYSYCSSYPTLRSVFILSVILTLLKAELIKMVILYLSKPFSSCTV